jgi:hypothetical protein
VPPVYPHTGCSVRSLNLEQYFQIDNHLASQPEPVFLNVYRAPELIRKNEFRQPTVCSRAGRYDNPIPPQFLAPIDFLKIPALASLAAYSACRGGSFSQKIESVNSAQLS